MKIKTKVKFDLGPQIKTVFKNGNGDELADLIIKSIKDSVSVGLSPVRGIGRFVGYKNPDKYPRSDSRAIKAGKNVRPVNLKLTGDMLNDIDYSVNISKQSVTVGINGGLSKLKAETHNEGTQSGRVPQRKFLPTGQGEDFIVSIQRKMVDFFRSRISDIIAKTNKS